MKRAVILIGGGEHARVVAEAVRTQSAQFELRGFVDPAPCEEIVRRLGVARLGDDRALVAHGDALGVIAVGAIGDAELRAKLATRLAAQLSGWAAVVHASAWVSPSAEIGQGAVVMAGAVVQSGARIGEHAIVNSGAVLEHDVELGAFAHIAPGAVVGGGTRIGRGSFVGLGACVRDHVTIGAGCFVDMGAVLVGDLEDAARARGGRGA